MKPYRKQLETLGKRLLAVLFVYFLCRLTFLLANLSSFSEASLSEILFSFVAGNRFDLSAIAFTNALVVLLHIIPTRAFFRPGYQKAVNIIFLVCNAPAILLNCIDLEYFKYQGKRTTADLFGLFTMGSDMQNTLPAMVRDFWYVLLVFAGLFFVLIRISRSIKVQRPGRPQYHKTDWLKAVAVLALVVVAARGGFQYKPLGILSAAQHVPQRLVPLTLNTGFTMIRTIGKSTLEEREWFTPWKAAALFNTEKNFSHPEGFKPLNVVIVIMESFSAEYIGFLNGKGYTPVLDSLMRESLVFPNTFANAKKSIDGIPAIIAAIPTLMPFSYITSPYNGNTATSIASLLKQKNYVSGFFHGGNNGTMGFDNFAHMTGFDAYFGRNEYPGDGYDGHWGVFDEPYFSYFADQCAAAKQPFAHVIFSLSSHHPYSIPDHLKGRFPKGALPIHESIGYADYALGKFLEKARNQPWFQNTLFVLTADHTGPNHDPAYNSSTGMFRVPLLFFTGTGTLKGTNNRVAQQTDIIPSILDYLNYDQTFVNFGKSLFDNTAESRAINFTGNVYQAFSDSLVLQFDGEETVGLYNYIHDPLLEKDLSGQKTKSSDKLESYAKAVIQQFNGAMIRNEMTHSVKK